MEHTEKTGIRIASLEGKWLLFVTILGTMIALIDTTAVNVAIPTIGKDFNVGVSGIQWVISGYLITLSSLILFGGSLGDIYGRKKVFVLGVAIFGVMSAVCGSSPNISILIAARIAQGVGAALLTPGSLAMIEANFHPDDRGKAIGTWSGFIAIAAAIGPLLGGWFTQTLTWRLVFLINVPIVVIIIITAHFRVAETRDTSRARMPDVIGGVTASLGLGLISYLLIEGPNSGLSAKIIAGIIAAVVLVIFFFLRELRAKDPMVPFKLFRSRQFSGANIVTFVVYSALGGTIFLLVLQFQESLGYGPIAAGLSLLPITCLMFVLSPRMGALSARIGPRLPMTIGPVIIGISLLPISQLGPGERYFTSAFPWIILFGIGLATVVAPLTVTVLAAVGTNDSGIASGINNAVARVAGLLSVAALPFVVSLSGDDYTNVAKLSKSFEHAMIICSVLAFMGGALSWITIRNPKKVAQ